MSNVIELGARDAVGSTSSTLKAFAVLETLVRAGGPVTLSELMVATGLPNRRCIARSLCSGRPAGDA
jgi:hypothetical protein